MFNVRVALRQRVPGEARNAIAACFGALANVKNVFVVDPDIDIFSDEQMDWALATRFQPDRDLIVMERHAHLAARSLAAPGARIGAKAGFDLTWPFGTGDAARNAGAGAADVRRQALRLGRGRARRRAEVLRGADGRGGQPRRPRGGAHARRACATSWRSTATAKGATSSSPGTRGHANRRAGQGETIMRVSVVELCWPACTLGAVLAPAADAPGG